MKFCIHLIKMYEGNLAVAAASEGVVHKLHRCNTSVPDPPLPRATVAANEVSELLRILLNWPLWIINSSALQDVSVPGELYTMRS